MITYFMQLNVKLLFVLILFGFIMGQTRHAAIQNFSNKNRSYLILDLFNLVGTPVHEIGHLLFGLIFGYKIDQICLYRTTKKALHSGGTLGFVKMHHKNHSFLQKLQGDFGLLFKGPYHVDALMRLPMIWRPARSQNAAPARVAHPVGQVDLAPTFCRIAGIDVPDWMQGKSLPLTSREADAQKRERVLTEWDSEFKGISVHLRTIYRDGFVCTVYEKSTLYDGDEGELYDLRNDPLQWRNLWNEPKHRRLRAELVADLHASLPQARQPRLEAVASV